MTLIPAIKLSREELNQLVVDYQKTNDNELLDKIVSAMVKLCVKLAYRFCEQDCHREDCVSEALIGVIRAARTYKIDNETKRVLALMLLYVRVDLSGDI
jgi:DNA-directed RNA polymerase specialized sigma subunit